jgi:Skp family chaperone for outer membrane proteins
MSMPMNSADPCSPQRFVSFRAAGCTAIVVLVGLCVFLAYQPSASARAVAMEPAPEHPIAVVALPMIVTELMRSDRYVPDRERLQEEYQGRITEIEEQLRAIVRRYEGQNPNPEDPAVLEDQRRYQQLGQQMTNLQREAAQAFEQLTAKQLLDAFDLARSATQAVAEDMGYAYAIASVGEDEEMVAGDSSAAVRQMLARPMIHFPERADITPEVRAELRL